MLANKPLQITPKAGAFELNRYVSEVKYELCEF